MKLVFLDLPEDKRGRKEPSFDMNGNFSVMRIYDENKFNIKYQ
jgi:hypothetical protein